MNANGETSGGPYYEVSQHAASGVPLGQSGYLTLIWIPCALAAGGTATRHFLHRRSSHRLLLDDILLITGTVFMVTFNILLSVLAFYIIHGSDDFSLVSLTQRYLFITNFIFYSIMFTAQAGILLSFHRLFPTPNRIVYIRSAIMVTAIIYIVNVILNSVGCIPYGSGMLDL